MRHYFEFLLNVSFMRDYDEKNEWNAQTKKP